MAALVAYAIIEDKMRSRPIDRLEVANVIRTVQKQLQWKPASAERHLYKRIQRGHLPSGATIVDYERIIQTLLHEATAQVYVYWYLSKDASKPYIAIVAPINNQSWLVMLDFEGILESAYVVERPQYYLSEPAFEWIGRLGELL